MFDVETNHQHTGKALLQFLLQRFVIIRIVTVAEHSCHFQFRLLILDDVDSAESYHTAEERSVLLRLYIILFDDTERCLIALADSIDLMTTQRTVEI